jgi:hypothetical protein
MTHDELLAICDNYSFKDSAEPVKALRAVVELHKPVEYATGGSTAIGNPAYFPTMTACSCSRAFNEYDRVPYPCPTIKAIDKELG